MVNGAGCGASYDGAKQKAANSSTGVTPAVVVAAKAYRGKGNSRYNGQDENDQ